MQTLSEKEYADMREKYEDEFRAGMGAEAIQELLAEIDVERSPRNCARSWKQRRARRRHASSSGWKWWRHSINPVTGRIG